MSQESPPHALVKFANKEIQPKGWFVDYLEGSKYRLYTQEARERKIKDEGRDPRDIYSSYRRD